MENVFRSVIPDLVAKAMSRFRVPGIVVSAVGPNGSVYRHTAGTDARGQPLGDDSIFAVASITKLATALTVLRLVDQGRLKLDEPLASIVPEAAAAQTGVTVRRLLCHSSGLPFDLDNSSGPVPTGDRWSDLAKRCLRVPLVTPPATRVQYSNVGYGLLAVIVERTLEVTFQSAMADLVLRPLGMEAYLGREPDRPTVIVADVRGSRAQTEHEPFNTRFWFELGLPWSGLMATPDATLRLIAAFDEKRSSLIRPETALEATRNQTDDLPGGFAPPLIWQTAWWGLGPDLRDQKSPHWTPANASPRTYGHSGASGAMVYHDPSRGVSWSILGSRTADNGWLLLGGPIIGSALLEAEVST